MELPVGGVVVEVVFNVHDRQIATAVTASHSG